MQVDAAAGGSRAAHVGDGLRMTETAASVKRESRCSTPPNIREDAGELMQPPVVWGAAAFGGDSLTLVFVRFAHRKRPPVWKAA